MERARKHRKKITKVSINDVAKKTGVSIATVSRVINKNSSVKEYNREKVKRVIAELGFSPDVTARRLAGGKIRTIGLILPRFDNMFHTFYVTEIMRSICNTANECGLDVLVHLTSKEISNCTAQSHLENISFCSGVIFADVQGNEDLLKHVIDAGVPCIVMNHLDKALNAGCISIDNKGGARDAIEYILSKGHKRIATITGDLAIQAGRERLDGYKQTLKKHGIPIIDELIKECDFSPACAIRRTRELLALSEYPTAIFVASDEMAVEVIKTLLKKKVRVPQDISVVGFDDSWFATQGPVALTTVKQPLNAMAQKAVSDIKNLLYSKTKMAPSKKTLPTQLIVRESCVSPLRQDDFY